MRKPTRKQKALVRQMVLDPDASLSELGERAGYCSKMKVHAALQTPVVQNEIAKVRAVMDQREKLSLGALLDKLQQGLDATEIRSFKVKGSKLKVSAEVVDHYARHKYLETALELRGAKGNKAGEAAAGPISLTLIMQGGANEEEKQEIRSLLMMTRWKRGLHPTEHRMMTEQERKQFDPYRDTRRQK